MHKIIEENNLKGSVRWLVAQKNPKKNGEMYRMIAGMILISVSKSSYVFFSTKFSQIVESQSSVESHLQTMHLENHLVFWKEWLRSSKNQKSVQVTIESIIANVPFFASLKGLQTQYWDAFVTCTLSKKGYYLRLLSRKKTVES